MHSEDSPFDSLSIANRVRDLMDRHGVAKRAQASKLASILGLSFSAASRKMKGQLPWTLDQLNDVAAHFHETPSVLIEALPLDSAPLPGEPQNAILEMEARTWPCLAWVGKELGNSTRAELVATRHDHTWHIHPVERAPSGPKFSVELIQFRPQQIEADRPTVAVVDDDKVADTADIICEYLNERGFHAIAYYSAGSFQAAVHQTAFDAFVVDWLLDGETAEASIKDIRASENPQAPVFLLTGQLDAGNANEEDIARVIRTFDVNCLEKPARLPLLIAELSRKLGITE